MKKPPVAYSSGILFSACNEAAGTRVAARQHIPKRRRGLRSIRLIGFCSRDGVIVTRAWSRTQASNARYRARVWFVLFTHHASRLTPHASRLTPHEAALA